LPRTLSAFNTLGSESESKRSKQRLRLAREHRRGTGRTEHGPAGGSAANPSRGGPRTQGSFTGGTSARSRPRRPGRIRSRTPIRRATTGMLRAPSGDRQHDPPLAPGEAIRSANCRSRFRPRRKSARERLSSAPIRPGTRRIGRVRVQNNPSPASFASRKQRFAGRRRSAQPARHWRPNGQAWDGKGPTRAGVATLAGSVQTRCTCRTTQRWMRRHRVGSIPIRGPIAAAGGKLCRGPINVSFVRRSSGGNYYLLVKADSTNQETRVGGQTTSRRSPFRIRKAGLEQSRP